jgi:hypothetical protein
MGYNPLAATCPICGTAAPEPCIDDRIHMARDRASRKLANAVAEMYTEQDRVAKAKARRHHIHNVLKAEPHGIDDAVYNKQVLNKSPSRRATAPYPIVSSGRGFTK